MAVYKASFALVIVGLVLLLGAGFALLADPLLIFELLTRLIPGSTDSSLEMMVTSYIALVMAGIYGLGLCVMGLSVIFVDLDQHYLAKRKRAAQGNNHQSLTEEQLQLQDKAWYDTLMHGKNLLGL